MVRLGQWSAIGAIAVGYLLMSRIPDLRFGTPEMVAFSGVQTVLIAGLLYLSSRRALPRPTILILGFALLIRIPFILQQPVLSDDIWRYLWDGYSILRGVNPFAYAPADVSLTDPGWLALQTRINHPELVTIYPPFAQLLFAIGALAGPATFGFKFVLVAIEYLGILAVIELLQRSNRSPLWAIAWAWHPLAVLETAHSGHIDTAAVSLAVLALFALQRKRDLFASALLTGAIWTKLLPLIFAPAIWWRSRRKPVFLLLSVALSAVLILPFASHLGNGLQTLGIYSANWEFGGLAFNLLRDGVGSGQIARLLLAAGFVLIWIGMHLRWMRRFDSGQENLWRLLYAIAWAYLLLTPTLHPWYVLYLLVLVPLAGGPIGLVFAWAVLLSYQTPMIYGITGEWREEQLPGLLIISVPLTGAVRQVVAAISARAQSRRES